MSKSVAFLRAMNVGGRRITNADLTAHVEALGFTDVSTYRASGNVIFAGEASAEVAEERLQRGLQERLGYAVPAFVRSAAELRSMVADQPFDAALVAASAGKVQVTIYGGRPSDEAREQVLALSCEADRLAFVGRELYWLPSGPMSQSELDHKAIVRALGHGTTRTLGTLENLCEKVGR